MGELVCNVLLERSEHAGCHAGARMLERAARDTCPRVELGRELWVHRRCLGVQPRGGGRVHAHARAGLVAQPELELRLPRAVVSQQRVSSDVVPPCSSSGHQVVKAIHA